MAEPRTPEQIEGIIRNYLMEEFLTARPDIILDSEFNIVEEGIIDSLGILRLVSFLEDQFGLAVHPSDIALKNFQTLIAIRSFVTTKQAEAASPAPAQRSGG